MTTVLSVGHGTASADELGGRLRAAGVTSLVDIRIAPGSRRHPQFARDEMERWLAAYDVAYRWDRRLGGFRRMPPDSPDLALRNESFRAYAAWMRSSEFLAALDELVAGARLAVTAVMCSESLWWRCHRRLVADVLVLARGVDVRHLMPDGRQQPHRPTAAARLGADGLLVYDRCESP